MIKTKMNDVRIMYLPTDGFWGMRIINGATNGSE